MSDGIEASGSIDVTQMVSALRLLKTELDGVSRSLGGINNNGDKAKRTLQDNFRESAKVAGKAGGPAGGFISKLSSGAGMDDIFGRLAVGVSLATLAFKGYQAAIDASLTRTQLLIAANKDLRNETDQTDKAVESLAKRGEAQAAGRTALIAAGGQRAAADADMVSSTGAATPDQAQRGTATLYGRFGDTDRARNAVDIAMRGAMAGLNFEEVANELTKLGRSIDDSSHSDRLLGRMVQRQTGGRGDPEELLRGRLGNLNTDDFIKKAREQAGVRSAIPGIERTAFLGSDVARKDLAEASGPGAAIASESFKKLEQTMDDLRQLSKAQGPVMGFLADIFKPEGSFETQLRRIAIANAEARGIGEPVYKGPTLNQAVPNFDLNNFGQ
jgi:hypothetical protein